MQPPQGRQEIKGIALIGEYTTSGGPGLDDHFLVVVDADGNEHTFRPTELPEILAWLKDTATAGLDTKLHAKTTEASRIIFPYTLAERELYKFSYLPAESWFLRILFVRSIRREYTDEVQRYLRGLQQGRAKSQ